MAILRAFAEILEFQEACAALERPFVHYVGNQAREVRKHFYGLREAEPKLLGIALFDQMQEIPPDLGAQALAWERREIENYLCSPEVLETYAAATSQLESAGPLFKPAESSRRIQAMKESIREVETALETLGKPSPWDGNAKVSDDFLVPLFEKYFSKLGLPNVMAKKNFHELARLVPKDTIEPEVKHKLNAIVEVAKKARPSPS